MILNLSDHSNDTLQNQLIQQLRALILSGDLSEASELPSIRGLASEQRVSVITVQRAYEALERHGLIRARRGKGFFVTALAPEERKRLALARFEAAMQPQLEQAQAEGLSATELLASVSRLLEGVPS